MAKTNIIFLTRCDTIVGCSTVFRKLGRAGNFDNSKSLNYLLLYPILSKTALLRPPPPKKKLNYISTILINSLVIKLEIPVPY
jgi:inorganic pyrophosphatase/exopolyphosphatase